MGYSLIAVFIAFSINYAAYLRRFTEEESNLFQRDSMRLQRSWDTAKPRHFQDHPAAGDQENPSICDK